MDNIAQPISAVPSTTSNATIQMALRAVCATVGFSMEESGSRVMTPVRLAIASTPLRARITPTNEVQFRANDLCEGSRWANVRCGRLIIIMAITITNVGMARVNAMLP